MRVLVAGGAGYIGSVLSRELWARGDEVTVLDRLLFGGESIGDLVSRPRFRLVAGDIRDEALLAKIVPGHDAVCLLAAIVGEPACNRDEREAVATNLEGARTVLGAARRAGVERFVFTSTCSNYGVSAPDTLVTEAVSLNPLSTYARSKVEAEQAVLAARTDAFCPTVLRISTAFGVSLRMRFDLLVSDFTLAAVRDRRVQVYGEQFWRPFVHVQDIAGVILRVLDAEAERVSGEVFNVGSNAANTQKLALAREVQRQVAGTALELVEVGHDPRSYRVDFTKLVDQLGYRARWSIEDGVREVHTALSAGVWRDPSDARFYN